jgi:hypothetical protein
MYILSFISLGYVRGGVGWGGVGDRGECGGGGDLPKRDLGKAH